MSELKTPGAGEMRGDAFTGGEHRPAVPTVPRSIHSPSVDVATEVQPPVSLDRGASAPVPVPRRPRRPRAEDIVPTMTVAVADRPKTGDPGTVAEQSTQDRETPLPRGREAAHSGVFPPIKPPTDGRPSGSESGEPEKREVPLTDEQAGAQVASEGNSEIKGVTILLFRRGEPFTGWNLFQELKGVQEGEDGWVPSHSMPENYCVDSFMSVGHVVKVEVGDDLHAEYYITDKGDTDGKALAGWLTNFSEKQPVLGLHDYFGGTTGPSKKKGRAETSGEGEKAIEVQAQDGEDAEDNIQVKRSPYIRLKIYKALKSHNPPTSLSALSQAIGEDDRIVENHMSRMKGAKIITYKSHKLEEPKIQFMREADGPAERPTSNKRVSLLANRLWDVIPQGVLLSARQATDLLVNAYKDSPDPWSNRTQNITDLDQDELRLAVSRALSAFSKQGHLTRKDFGTFEFTDIAIHPEQEGPVAELIDIMDRFQEGRRDFLEQGRALGRQLIGNKERVAAVLRKAKMRSPHKQRQPAHITRATIADVAGQFTAGATLTEIQDALAEVEGRRRQDNGLWKHITAMEEAGTMHSTTEHGGRKRYFVGPKPKSG